MKRDRGWWLVFAAFFVAAPLSVWLQVALIRYIAGGN